MSDSNIEHGIVEFLRARQVIGLHSLNVHAHQGVAEVRGWAETVAARKLCIECCRRVTGVRQVIDLLEGAAV